MVLADSSIWIDHFCKANDELKELLNSDRILTHPFILGELCIGNFRKRDVVLTMLKLLPKAIVASDEEVGVFIEKHQLYGLGVGYIEMHLLASAILTKTRLWTGDKKLKEIAINLGCAYGKH